METEEKPIEIIEEKPYDYKGLWMHKGVNIGNDGRLRCPHCNWILAEGMFPAQEQKFVCSKCKKESTFRRIAKT